MKGLVRNYFGRIMLAVLLIGLSGWAFYAYKGGERGRQEIVAFYAEIDIGDAVEDLRRTFAAKRFRYLRMKEISTNVICIFQWPVARLANDWRILIQLEDSVIVGARIRLLEGPDFHPSEAPPDKTNISR